MACFRAYKGRVCVVSPPARGRRAGPLPPTRLLANDFAVAPVGLTAGGRAGHDCARRRLSAELRPTLTAAGSFGGSAWCGRSRAVLNAVRLNEVRLLPGGEIGEGRRSAVACATGAAVSGVRCRQPPPSRPLPTPLCAVTRRANSGPPPPLCARPVKGRLLYSVR